MTSSSVTFSILGGGGTASLVATDNNGQLYYLSPSSSSSTLAALGYLPLKGGAMTGSIDMGNNNITNMYDLTVGHKLTVSTIDPLYYINGVNYSTFASSIAGGVKEECVGKIKLEKKAEKTGEFEAIINFSDLAEGSDLWVWRKIVDFSKDNVDIAITPYGQFASVYYLIDGNKLIFRSDRAVEISYRLIGKRFDWRLWPTRPEEQNGQGTLIK